MSSIGKVIVMGLMSGKCTGEKDSGPAEIAVPHKHAGPGIIRLQIRKAGLHCAPNWPCVAEVEILRQLHPGQQLSILLLLTTAAELQVCKD